VWLCERLLVVDGVAIFAKLVVSLAVAAALWIEKDSRDVPRVLVAGLALELMASAANTWMAAAIVSLAAFDAAALTIVAALGWLAGLGGSADFEMLRAGLFEIAPRHSFAVAAASCVVLGAMLVRFASAASRIDGLARGMIVAVALPASILAFLSRFFLGALSEPTDAARWLALPGVDWRPPLAFAAAVTMAWGSAAVLRAPSYGRLLGASSIANLGFALVGLSAASVDGLRAALLFLGVSAVSTIGAFVVASRGRGFVQGAALALFLVAIATGGRAPLLATAVAVGEPALAGLGILSAGSLLLAYARVFRILLTPAREAEWARLPADDLCCVALLAFATIVTALYPEPLVRFASRSAHLLPF
jgi:formate hydrogenlyase subunit 3/multisubunit Na+/H+ antiporter MnhD subunit